HRAADRDLHGADEALPRGGRRFARWRDEVQHLLHLRETLCGRQRRLRSLLPERPAGADLCPDPRMDRAVRHRDRLHRGGVTVLAQPRIAASSSSGRSIISMWPAPGSTTVRAPVIAAASALPPFAGVIMSRSPRTRVVGTVTLAARSSMPE